MLTIGDHGWHYGRPAGRLAIQSGPLWPGDAAFACGSMWAHVGAEAPDRAARGNKVKAPRSISVPKAMQAKYDAVVMLTDAFCRDHLNEEYRDLACAMTAALCRKRPSPLASSQPHMAMADLCAAFGVCRGRSKSRPLAAAGYRLRAPVFRKTKKVLSTCII